MKNAIYRFLGWAGFAFALFLHPLGVQAQDLPAMVRIVVPYPPGGPTDLFARIVANGLKDRINRTVIVENRPGAGGVLGSRYVGKATPDGGTLLLGLLGPLAIGPATAVDPFDPIKELTPIRLIATVNTVAVVPKKHNVKSVAEFVALAKNNPGKMHFASAGQGSLPHLLGELLKRETGVDIVHVPYGGGAPAVTATFTGEVDLLFADVPVVMPHIKSGALVPIAVTGTTREATLADVPTFTEAGFPNVASESWYGILAPQGTPPAIVKKLEEAVEASLGSAEVKEQLDKQGAQVPKSDAAQFSVFLAAQVERWGKIARAVLDIDKK